MLYTFFHLILGLKSSLVWSGRLPETEVVTFPDNQNNVTVPRSEAVKALVCIVDKQEHTRRRQPWARGFSTSALKGYETLVTKRTLQLMEVLLSKKPDEAINLTTWISFFKYAAVILVFALE